MNEAFLRVIEELLAEAADGQVTLDELYRRWPGAMEDQPALEPVFEDIVDGVDHFPLKFWSREPDLESWHMSDMYWRVCVDLEVVRAARIVEELLKCREDVLNSVTSWQDVTTGVIKSKISHCLSSRRRGESA